MFTNARIVARAANPDSYFKTEKQRGDPAYPMSSSSVRAASDCPARWVAGYESPETDAKIRGSLQDCRYLTPEQFDSRYVVRPATYPAPAKHAKVKSGEIKEGDPLPWNANAAVCEEWAILNMGREIVTEAALAQVDLAIKRLMDDEILRTFHESCDRQVWLEGDWEDEATGLVIPCKALLDYVPRQDTEFAKCSGDLKCVTSAMRVPFSRQVYRYGWHIQAAWDLDLLSAAEGGSDRNTWVWVAQETYPPYQPARRMCGQELLAIGRQSYQFALARYARCLKSGFWPGYDDHAEAVQGWSVVDAEPWMAFEAQSKAMEAWQADAAEESVEQETSEDLIP